MGWYYMYVKKYGENEEKVLVIHGWLHSNKRYEKLAKDLSKDYEVHVVCLPGFGGKQCPYKDDIINNYVKDLGKIITEENFTLIVAHSLGCNITLKALNKNRSVKSKLILLTPSYGPVHIFKKLRFIKIIAYIFFYIIATLPLFMVKYVIKLIAKLGVSESKYNDDILINDIRSANPYVATKLMIDLGNDNWKLDEKLENETIIVKSEYDKIIPSQNIDILCKGLKNYKLINFINCGHTPILEDYEHVLKIIYNFTS